MKSKDSHAKIETLEGVVKWFDPRKGFGFIIGPDGQDIFVHYSCIQGEGFRVLKDGATVIYDAEESGKGWKATKVQIPDPTIVVTERQHIRSPRI